MDIGTVNLWLAVAGAGCLAAALVHSTVGERLFVRPIVARMDWTGIPLAPSFARQVVRLAWHITSIGWAAFGAILLAPLMGWHGIAVAYWAALAAFAAGWVMTGPGTGWRHRGWPMFALITLAIGAALALRG